MRKMEREKAEAERRARISRQAEDDDPTNTKSKFDSDSEDEKDAVDMFSEAGRAKLSPKRNGASPPRKSSPEPAPVRSREEEFRFQTPEEEHQEMMLKVRRTLTELLLEVTNDEMHSLCQEVLQKAVLKAPARQLRSSSALANITGGLGGLSGYGSDSESSSGAESGDDSEEELQRCIRDKRAAFAQWEHQVAEELDEEDRQHERRLQQQAAQKVTEDGGVRNSNRPAEKSAAGALDTDSPKEASHEETAEPDKNEEEREDPGSGKRSSRKNRDR
ncbi:hypothetical protein MRX96_007890 [Rhipicephalus microplus]